MENSNYCIPKRAYLTVKKYGDKYKIVALKREPTPITKKPKKEGLDLGKYESNLIRAKTSVHELIVCNEWQYFATFTLNSQKQDRFNIGEFKKDLAQFVRDKRKKYGTKVQYVFVPEMHANGAWHMHGVISGLPDEQVRAFEKGLHPADLVNSDYVRWLDYEQRFGFCSLGRIVSRDKTASYIAKYISKNLANGMDNGENLYLCSHGLKRAELCYKGWCEVEKYPEWENEFCMIEWSEKLEIIVQETNEKVLY